MLAIASHARRRATQHANKLAADNRGPLDIAKQVFLDHDPMAELLGNFKGSF